MPWTSLEVPSSRLRIAWCADEFEPWSIVPCQLRRHRFGKIFRILHEHVEQYGRAVFAQRETLDHVLLRS